MSYIRLKLMKYLISNLKLNLFYLEQGSQRHILKAYTRFLTETFKYFKGIIGNLSNASLIFEQLWFHNTICRRLPIPLDFAPKHYREMDSVVYTTKHFGILVILFSYRMLIAVIAAFSERVTFATRRTCESNIIKSPGSLFISDIWRRNRYQVRVCQYQRLIHLTLLIVSKVCIGNPCCSVVLVAFVPLSCNFSMRRYCEKFRYNLQQKVHSS